MNSRKKKKEEKNTKSVGGDFVSDKIFRKFHFLKRLSSEIYIEAFPMDRRGERPIADTNFPFFLHSRFLFPDKFIRAMDEE